MTSIFPQCFDCSEFQGVVQGEAGRTYHCGAFPDGDGIPREILFNEVAHERPSTLLYSRIQLAWSSWIDGFAEVAKLK